MSRELLWLRRLRYVAQRLAVERDRAALLPLILDSAIELTDAERGFLVLVSRNESTGRVRLKVEEARGFDKSRILSGASKVSRTVVTRVIEEERAVVTTSAGDQDLTEVTSVKDQRVLSIISVPLRIRGELRGAVYLDHRFDRQAFNEDDVPVLSSFGDQAALALETAELEANTSDQDEKLGEALRDLEALRERRWATERGDGVLPAQLPRFGRLIGEAPAMIDLYDGIARAARCDAPVLISGPSGSGKELVAREVHARSERVTQPYLIFACAALAEGLVESELFGHVEGAFTGAERDRDGLFVQAGGGTLVIDEVADLSAELQAKLLRVLQAGVFRPLGAEAVRSMDCRVLATTQHDLAARVKEGLFREDLYYRLDVLRLSVPSLSARADDVPALVAKFLADEDATETTISAKALELLMAYPWPGNARELQSEVRRLVSKRTRQITSEHLSEEVQEGTPRLRTTDYSGKTLGDVERDMVEGALARAQGNKAKAARILGVPRSTLYDLMKRHGVS